MSDKRQPMVLEAARLTGLARELMERAKFESSQATLHSRANTNETSQKFATAHRALSAELQTEARLLTDRADAIYQDLRT